VRRKGKGCRGGSIQNRAARPVPEKEAGPGRADPNTRGTLGKGGKPASASPATTQCRRFRNVDPISRAAHVLLRFLNFNVRQSCIIASFVPLPRDYGASGAAYDRSENQTEIQSSFESLAVASHLERSVKS
jgi:hypothetical protein